MEQPAQARVVALIAGQGTDDINQTATRFAVYATDLGVMWRDSRGRVAIAFGDTYGEGWGGSGAGPETADWRFNTLGHSSDTTLSDGLRIDSMVTDRPGHAAQILPGDPSVPEVTVIPTAAISAGGLDYIHYMSVRSWQPGQRPPQPADVGGHHPPRVAGRRLVPHAVDQQVRADRPACLDEQHREHDPLLR